MKRLEHLFGLLALLACCFNYMVDGHGITDIATPQPLELHLSGMEHCCNSFVIPNATWDKTMACVNSTAVKHANTHLNDGSARIGIVTFATRNIWNYTTYSYGIGQAYAENHGYVFKHLDENSEGSEGFDSRDSRWNKIKVLEQALVGWGKELAYVVWVDADIAILDMGLTIEDVVSENPRAHLWSSAEHAGSTTLINSGTLIVRNSHFAKQFLHAWWSFADRALFSDQEQFDLLYKYCEDEWASSSSTGSHSQGGANFNTLFPDLKPFDIRKKVVILPPDALNSDPPAMTQQRPHNQVLHLMGEHTAFRRKVFQAGLVEVCRFVRMQGLAKDAEFEHALQGGIGDDQHYDDMMRENSCGTGANPDVPKIAGPVSSTFIPRVNILKPQLGLTQANLLQWTLEVYGQEADEALLTYSNSAKQGKFGVSESRRLANSVHHYAHALITKGGGGQHSKALDLRKRVWQLLQENIAGRRQLAAASGGGRGGKKVSADWPELLKVTAEAGQQLVSVGEISPVQRVAIAAEVSTLLEEILRVCHHAQRPAVQHMVAHMHAESGLMYLQQSQGSESLRYFHKSLLLYRQLSVKTGTHILVQPLTALANVLCTLKYFPQAFPLYEEAIRIAESNLGLRHKSLSNHYLNFGISQVEAGNMVEGAVLLRKVLHLCLINMDHDDNTAGNEYNAVCRKAEHYLEVAMPDREDRNQGI